MHVNTVTKGPRGVMQINIGKGFLSEKLANRYLVKFSIKDFPACCLSVPDRECLGPHVIDTLEWRPFSSTVTSCDRIQQLIPTSIIACIVYSGRGQNDRYVARCLSA